MLSKLKQKQSQRRTYFLGGTWPTLTRTQMTLRVCIPTEQEASSPRSRPAEVLAAGMDESSIHWPHEPVCQWCTVQGCSLQLRTSCRALALGHWSPPRGQWRDLLYNTTPLPRVCECVCVVVGCGINDQTELNHISSLSYFNFLMNQMCYDDDDLEFPNTHHIACC